MMDTTFGKSPEELSTKSSDGAYEDDDILQIPFSATKLRHSLSEGSRPVHKPVNGYNRMHSFHSTLADDDWKEGVSLENSKSDARFLPADFTETLLKDFPRLHKNGYQSHSFDEDIFDEAADKFSTGFFSESEIDDIPRSSLFRRAGLRRSTSHVEPQRAASRQDWKPETAVKKTDESSSRKAKIEELLRLKKQLEELKSWQANSESKQRSRDNRKDTLQEKETSKDDVDDLFESRLKVIKEKGKMKRRRLSTSKRTNSLSSKLMEELLEEEEEIPADSETTTPEKDSSKSSGKCRTRSSSDVENSVSPSSLRRESLDETFKLADRLGTKPWQDDFKHSLFNRHEDLSLRKKSLEKPLGERKLSLNTDDTASSPARNGDFRRSYSTSFDLNGIDRDLRESLQRRASKHSEKDDTGSGCDVSNARWKSQRHDGGLRRNDKQKDACSFHTEDVSSSLTSDGFKTSFNLRKERDRSREDLQQNRKPQERNGKQSFLHDRYGMDDIFKKFSFRGIPRMDFFEHESFARDDRRKKLMEEIGGIQRHLADITKYELRGRRQRPKQVDKDEIAWKEELGELGTRRSSSVVDLQAERSSLINHLKELLCQKQEREEEIRKKLDRSKQEECPDSTEKEKDEMTSDFPTKEEHKDKDKITGCDEDENKETIQRLPDEDEVSFILRSAGAEHYIPITKKNEITIDKLYQFMPADFAELGITNPDLQQRLQEEIDKHFVEQKNAQLKAAELESTKEGHKSKFSEGGGGASGACSGSSTPSTPIVDAPEGYEPDVPVHVTAECVICLDRQSNLLFLNCGHVCCCYDCSVDLTLCPLCRAEIAAKLIMNDSLPE